MADTVRSCSVIMTFDDIHLFLHVDQFYVFSPRAVPPPPTILPTSELTPELDLVGAALSRDSPALEEVVSLTSGKSGLRLGFATNCMSVSFDAGVCLPLLSSPEAGVQFYTNNFAIPDEGAWNKIHGGSGAVPLFLPSNADRRDVNWIAAAFLEFHAPLAAWLHPLESRGPTGDDTLLASGEVYNNFMRLDVWYKGSDSN